MKKLFSALILFLILIFLLLELNGCGTDAIEIEEDPPAYTENPWITAYLAAWNHNVSSSGDRDSMLTVDEIDWNAFTHLVYFSLRPIPEGIVIPIDEGNLVNPERVETVVSAAHQAGIPVMIAVGGWGQHENFTNAIRPENRSKFIASLVDVLTTWGFDGIDLNMEPIEDEDVPHYRNLVMELADEFDEMETPLLERPLLTATTDWQPVMFADLQEYFDQINLMTYDFSGPWEGWVSWHNSPVFNGGHTLSSGMPLPSIEKHMREFVGAGIAREKLGIGISFYGYAWYGQVDGPLQEWSTPPEVEENIPYDVIMENYYSLEHYHWDEEVQAAWLSISSDDPDQRIFISYTDERSISEKIEYARSQGFGGAILWDLGGGYRFGQQEGERNVLLRAVKEAIHN